MMKNYTLGAVVLFTALCIGSCTDYDYGFSEKSIQYDESFKSEFGDIDPNQDWIMATRVRADINLSNIPGSYKLNILTGNPANSNTRLLAQTTVVDGQASLNFDCIKGLDKVYITASKDGKYAICKEYPIVEGQLLVGNVTRGVVTRGAESVTVTDANVNVWRVSDFALNWKKENSDAKEYTDAFQIWTNGGDYELNKFSTQNVYKIHGAESKPGREFMMADLKNEIFCSGGVFAEGEDHISRYVKNGTLLPDATMTVKEDGPVTMELIWRGTSYDLAFGYFFFPENGIITPEYLWTTKKYILFGGDGSVSDESSLTQLAYAGESYSTWHNVDGQTKQWQNDDTKLRGTVFNLVNFENGQKSYNFTAGTKIGFFLYTVRGEKMFFSDCRSNYWLNHSIYRAYQTDQQDNENARPYAVTFNYKGDTYLGFGDYDLNDVVFMASNVQKAKPIVPELEPDPDPDPTPAPDPTPVTPESWMFACEDLGNMDDYDFNDIVWEVVNNYNEDGTFKDAKIRVLAAGGTLPFTLNYSGQKVCTKDDVYGRNSSATMFNTGQATGAIKEYSFPEGTLTGEWSPTNDASKFSVDITSGTSATSANYTVSLSKAGSAPQIILVPGGWEWPTERQKITSKYSKFADWVNNSNVDWLGNSRSSNINQTENSEVTGGDNTQTGGSTTGGDEEDDEDNEEEPVGPVLPTPGSVTISGDVFNTNHKLSADLFTSNTEVFITYTRSTPDNNKTFKICNTYISISASDCISDHGSGNCWHNPAGGNWTSHEYTLSITGENLSKLKANGIEKINGDLDVVSITIENK